MPPQLDCCEEKMRYLKCLTLYEIQGRNSIYDSKFLPPSMAIYCSHKVIDSPKENMSLYPLISLSRSYFSLETFWSSHPFCHFFLLESHYCSMDLYNISPFSQAFLTLVHFPQCWQNLLLKISFLSILLCIKPFDGLPIAQLSCFIFFKSFPSLLFANMNHKSARWGQMSQFY